MAWLKKFGASPKLTRWLGGVGVTTLASGTFVLAYLFSRFEHGTFGGIHGKIGFVFVALALFHLAKHRGWVKRKLFAR